METFFGELARQLVAVRKMTPERAAEVAGLIRDVSRERGWQWVEFGPALAATCAKLGIVNPSPRNLDAFLFNHD